MKDVLLIACGTFVGAPVGWTVGFTAGIIRDNNKIPDSALNGFSGLFFGSIGAIAGGVAGGLLVAKLVL